ncbi:MAG: hypothetical protein FWG40_06515 [Peptococcaceae bacterium]|nr:hypothetical protein [Peptococcaceae bacterium]
MGYVSRPTIILGGDRVVLAPQLMRDTLAEFGNVAEEILAVGNKFSDSITKGLGDPEIWSSPTNKYKLQDICDALFPVFDDLIQAIYDNQTAFETYIANNEGV